MPPLINGETDEIERDCTQNPVVPREPAAPYRERLGVPPLGAMQQLSKAGLLKTRNVAEGLKTHLATRRNDASWTEDGSPTRRARRAMPRSNSCSRAKRGSPTHCVRLREASGRRGPLAVEERPSLPRGLVRRNRAPLRGTSGRGRVADSTRKPNRAEGGQKQRLDSHPRHARDALRCMSERFLETSAQRGKFGPVAYHPQHVDIKKQDSRRHCGVFGRISTSCPGMRSDTACHWCSPRLGPTSTPRYRALERT